MRPDFNEVLTERPRVGHSRKHKEVRRRYNRFDYGDEDAPVGGIEGIKKPYRGDRKTNSDLWSSIRRFITSRVGRKWNDVWSEVCKDLKESDDMRAHFIAHVRIEVDQKVIVHENGRLYRPGGRFGNLNWNDPLPGVFKRHYVDPRDGILRTTPERIWSWRSKRPADETEKTFADGHKFRRIDGLWFEIKTVKELKTVGYDTVTRRFITKLVDVEKKSSPNRRVLRKYGLKNE